MSNKNNVSHAFFDACHVKGIGSFLAEDYTEDWAEGAPTIEPISGQRVDQRKYVFYNCDFSACNALPKIDKRFFKNCYYNHDDPPTQLILEHYFEVLRAQTRDVTCENKR